MGNREWEANNKSTITPHQFSSKDNQKLQNQPSNQTHLSFLKKYSAKKKKIDKNQFMKCEWSQQLISQLTHNKRQRISLRWETIKVKVFMQLDPKHFLPKKYSCIWLKLSSKRNDLIFLQQLSKNDQKKQLLNCPLSLGLFSILQAFRYNNNIQSQYSKILLMKSLKQDNNMVKLRNTLNELKQFTTRDHHKNHLQTPTIGITLISLQKYKKKMDKQGKCRTNRENIENDLKLQIFKKIRETMNSGLRQGGLEIAKATMHFNSKVPKPTSQQRTRIKKTASSQQRISQQKQRRIKSIRVRTQAASFRPYQSHYPYSHQRNSRKNATSERKFQTQRSWQRGQNEVKGWMVLNDPQDFQREEYIR